MYTWLISLTQFLRQLKARSMHNSCEAISVVLFFNFQLQSFIINTIVEYCNLENIYHGNVKYIFAGEKIKVIKYWLKRIKQNNVTF